MSDRVRKIFSEILKVSVDQLDDESSPENTPQWDSYAAMDLTLALEDEFGIRLTTKDIVSMRSIAIVKNVLRKAGVTDV
ncbi:MAG: acyl carrier protein [Rhodospirillaceae bacterium]|jgi:acyl carrier protein|nr:acyl carrier protein [Rhodospirillaceae bacterium]